MQLALTTNKQLNFAPNNGQTDILGKRANEQQNGMQPKYSQATERILSYRLA